MPDIHVSMLALQVPNLLPKTVPWIDFAAHKGLYINHHSQWVRHAGRLIWWSLIFIIGLVWAFLWTKKPKPPEPATWAQTILGAMAVWVMMALGYGTIPHEFITFGNSYLNFNTATFMLHKNRILPFDIPRSVAVDVGVSVIYGIVLTLQVWLFVRWQKRPAYEPAGEAEIDDATTSAGGPLARLRRRREARTSAYGRPVTTTAGE
jgi:hypothetical protein